MRDGLCAEERRRRIIEFLVANKQSTREILAEEFCVSKRTITRDIMYLTAQVPIFTKSGNNGGVYILPEYKYDSKHLSCDETECLEELLDYVESDKKVILKGIIERFSRISM